MNKKEKPKFSRREFLKVAAHATVTTGLSGLGAFKYSTQVEPNWMDVEEISLQLARLPKDFSGYRVVQFSDIHVDHWMNQARLKTVVDLVNQQNGDVIVITGDFMSEMPAKHHGMMVAELEKLSAPDGVFAVMGNHDYWTDVKSVRSIVKEAGIIELKNTVIPIQRKQSKLYLCGVDDVWENQQDLEAVVSALPTDPNLCAVLLCHEPDFADTSAACKRFDLQLSGHSHGGQVILPFVGPPILPRLGEKYPLGLYQVGEMWQYTNRGVGMASPQVRFNCRPEITVIELT